MIKKSLYRDTVNGKIGGVCAGLADYFDIEVRLLRILAVIAFVVGGGFVTTLVYIAAMLILEKKPFIDAADPHNKDDGNYNPRSSSFSSVDTTITKIENQMLEMEHQVANMEAYVTSSEFELNRKFKQL